MRQHSLKPGCNNRVTVSRSLDLGDVDLEGGHRRRQDIDIGGDRDITWGLELKSQNQDQDVNVKIKTLTCFGGLW